VHHTTERVAELYVTEGVEEGVEGGVEVPHPRDSDHEAAVDTERAEGDDDETEEVGTETEHERPHDDP